MRQRTVIVHKMGQSIAVEKQLLVEEKWIIDALTKVRNQRNSLQIERLHLESLKARSKGATAPPPKSTENDKDEHEQSTSAVNMMQNPTTSSSSQVLNIETLCNEEELNLCVTSPILRPNVQQMEYDEETEEEEEDVMDMSAFLTADSEY